MCYWFTGVIVVITTYIDRHASVEIAAASEDKVADGAIESVWSPGLTEIMEWRQICQEIMGGVVTGRSVA